MNKKVWAAISVNTFSKRVMVNGPFFGVELVAAKEARKQIKTKTIYMVDITKMPSDTLIKMSTWFEKQGIPSNDASKVTVTVMTSLISCLEEMNN